LWTGSHAAGFGNLTTIGGVLTVQTNPALISITGMKNVAAVTSITINGNNFLSVLPELVRVHGSRFRCWHLFANDLCAAIYRFPPECCSDGSGLMPSRCAVYFQNYVVTTGAINLQNFNGVRGFAPSCRVLNRCRLWSPQAPMVITGFRYLRQCGSFQLSVFRLICTHVSRADPSCSFSHLPTEFGQPRVCHLSQSDNNDCRLHHPGTRSLLLARLAFRVTVLKLHFR
jgi:hypothetical protein